MRREELTSSCKLAAKCAAAWYDTSITPGKMIRGLFQLMSFRHEKGIYKAGSYDNPLQVAFLDEFRPATSSGHSGTLPSEFGIRVYYNQKS